MRRRGWLAFGFFTACLAAAGVPVAHASLLGDSVDLAWYQPTPTTLGEDDGVQVVGPGIEYPSVVSDLFTVDIGATTVTVSHARNFATEPESNVAFYGMVLTDLTQNLDGWSFDPANTLTQIPTASITVVDGQLTVDTVGFLWGETQELVLDLTVPEPAGMSLLILPLLAMARARRSRTR